MMTLALLVGLWSTSCIQTQIANLGQGYVVESYLISETGDFEFTREWFQDPTCTESHGKNVEEGLIRMGPKMSGMFVSGETFQADFISNLGTDLGAVTVKENHSLKFARGTKGSSFRNTMVGFFEYLKK